MKKAVQSTEVVNKFYPAQVRDRMFDKKKDDNSKKSHDNHKNTKHQKKTAKDTLELTSAALHAEVSAGDLDRDDDGIIADSYPNTTILFADLAGFTAWSDGRLPKHVFQLLERLYGAFDKIAKKRSVFKVETIGDCYLALSGCPMANEKQAVTMSRFAVECLFKMNQIVEQELVGLLGPTTASLKLRVDLNSGAVTAGVLRGDRARFQLFGDTVNVASRMESNSAPGKIQVSESTADLLVEAEKGHWLVEREGGIVAKGKGRMGIFWLQTDSVKNVVFPAATTTAPVASATSSSVASEEDGESMEGKGAPYVSSEDIEGGQSDK